MTPDWTQIDPKDLKNKQNNQKIIKNDQTIIKHDQK